MKKLREIFKLLLFETACYHLKYIIPSQIVIFIIMLFVSMIVGYNYNNSILNMVTIYFVQLLLISFFVSVDLVAGIRTRSYYVKLVYVVFGKTKKFVIDFYDVFGNEKPEDEHIRYGSVSVSPNDILKRFGFLYLPVDKKK